MKKTFKRMGCLIISLVMLFSLASITTVNAAETTVTVTETEHVVAQLGSATFEDSAETPNRRLMTNASNDTTVAYDTVYLSKMNINEIRSASSVKFNTKLYIDNNWTYKLTVHASPYTSWTKTNVDKATLLNAGRFALSTKTVDGTGTMELSFDLEVEELLKHADSNGYVTLILTAERTSVFSSLPSGKCNIYSLDYEQTITAVVNTIDVEDAELTVLDSERVRVQLGAKELDGTRILSKYGDLDNYNTVLLGKMNINALRTASSAKATYSTLLYIQKNYDYTLNVYAIDYTEWNKDSVDTNKVKNAEKVLLGTLTLPGKGTATVDIEIDVQKLIQKADAKGNVTLILEAARTESQSNPATSGPCSANMDSAQNIKAMVTTGETYFYDKSATGDKTITTVTELEDSREIIAKRVVVKGSAGEAISAIPIIALYDNDALVKVSMGDAIILDGTAKLAEASVTVPENTELTSPKVTLFLWTSLQELVPVLDSNSFN